MCVCVRARVLACVCLCVWQGSHGGMTMEISVKGDNVCYEGLTWYLFLWWDSVLMSDHSLSHNRAGGAPLQMISYKSKLPFQNSHFCSVFRSSPLSAVSHNTQLKKILMPWKRTWGSLFRSPFITLCFCTWSFSEGHLLDLPSWCSADSILKSRDIALPAKVRMIKAMAFPVSHVWIWDFEP